MTLTKPKFRRNWQKHFYVCRKCGCYFQADGRGCPTQCKICKDNNVRVKAKDYYWRFKSKDV